MLIQKVAKELLAGIQKKSVTYPAGLVWNGQLDRAGLLELITLREKMLGEHLAAAMQASMAAGKTLYEYWMGEGSDTIQAFGKAFGERICATAFYDAQKGVGGTVVGHLYDMYCLQVVVNGLVCAASITFNAV